MSEPLFRQYIQCLGLSGTLKLSSRQDFTLPEDTHSAGSWRMLSVELQRPPCDLMPCRCGISAWRCCIDRQACRCADCFFEIAPCGYCPGFDLAS